MGSACNIMTYYVAECVRVCICVCVWDRMTLILVFISANYVSELNLSRFVGGWMNGSACNIITYNK